MPVLCFSRFLSVNEKVRQSKIKQITRERAVYKLDEIV